MYFYRSRYGQDNSDNKISDLVHKKPPDVAILIGYRPKKGEPKYCLYNCIDEALEAIKSDTNVKFKDLLKVCESFFVARESVEVTIFLKCLGKELQG